MAEIRVNVSFIQAADVIIKINKTIRSQNIKLCEIGYKNNPDDIDEEYINPDLSNLLNVLAALIKTHSKSKPNPKAKNVKIIQECVKKKKQYTILRILYWNKYIDAPQQANPAN